MRLSTGEISRREKKVAEPGIEQRKVHWVEVAFTLLRRACVPPKPQKLKIYLSCATFIWPRLLLEHIRSNDKHNVRNNQGNLLVWQAEHLWSLQFIHLFIPNQNHVETFRSLIQAHNWKDAEVMSIIFHLFCFSLLFYQKVTCQALPYILRDQEARWPLSYPHRDAKSSLLIVTSKGRKKTAILRSGWP